MSKKVLAIDFGTKRIGLAVSRGTLAEPLTVLLNDDSIFDKIDNIINQERVVLVVIGLSENEMAEKIKKFAEKLETHIAVPIEFFDETLSSKTVREKIQSSHIKRSKRSKPIDHYAAAVILEEWMESREQA